MIINHKYKYIFFKTSKTAGTSIEITLSKYCGAEDTITPLTPEDEEIRKSLGYQGPQHYHAPASDYTLQDLVRLIFNKKRRRKVLFHKHSSASVVKPIIGNEAWNSYFKFCFERNPWDRFISFYYYKTTLLNLDPRPTISEFLRSPYPLDLKRKGIDIYTIDGKVVVDRICRFENLVDEMEKVRTQLGIQDKLVLPHAKSNFRPAGQSYHELLNTEQREEIARIFHEEIELLNYTF